MAINSKVKWYSNAMAGMPVQSTANQDVAGKCVELLDCLLVNGVNLVTVDSIVVSNNVATVTRSAGLNFLVDQVIEIAGVSSPAALNGQWRVASIDPGTKSLTFNTSGISDGAASGTMTCKTPGLGWTLAFTGTNKRVYRSPNEDSPRSYYLINDSATSNGVGGINAYGSMTSISDGTDFWHNGDAYVGIPRNYAAEFLACGDDRTFWIRASFYSSYNGSIHELVMGFGDYISLKPNDAHNEFVSGIKRSVNPSWNSLVQAIGWSTTFANEGRVLRRGNPGYPVRCDGVPQAGQLISGGGGLPFPSIVGNQILVTDALIREEGAGGNPVRGRCRGLYWVMSNAPLVATLAPQFVTGVVGLEDRVCALMYVSGITVNNNAAQTAGRVLFDIYGPWE